jgi:hypothetical protein
MKIFNQYYSYDYGHDAYFIIVNSPRLNLLQVELHTTEYWSWEPDIRLTFEMFSGKVLGIRLILWSVALAVDILNYRYPMDLTHIRE